MDINLSLRLQELHGPMEQFLGNCIEQICRHKFIHLNRKHEVSFTETTHRVHVCSLLTTLKSFCYLILIKMNDNLIHLCDVYSTLNTSVVMKLQIWFLA